MCSHKCECDFYVKQAYELHREITKLRNENIKLMQVIRRMNYATELVLKEKEHSDNCFRLKIDSIVQNLKEE